MSCTVELGATVEWPELGQGLIPGASGVLCGNVMAATYVEFARRLHQALDDAGFVKGRLRTGELARDNNVSRETARKWLSGLALPELERMIGLAVKTGVSFEWLATGRGDAHLASVGVREERPPLYVDGEEMRLIGIVRRLPKPQQRALLVLLEK